MSVGHAEGEAPSCSVCGSSLSERRELLPVYVDLGPYGGRIDRVIETSRSLECPRHGLTDKGGVPFGEPPLQITTV